VNSRVLGRFWDGSRSQSVKTYRCCGTDGKSMGDLAPAEVFDVPELSDAVWLHDHPRPATAVLHCIRVHLGAVRKLLGTTGTVGTQSSKGRNIKPLRPFPL
jgi:hypothetical protein